MIGAGPAGSVTAIHLARAGRDVVLIDKARFPRDKCCGDGLTTGALRRLEALGLDPGAVASWQPVTQAVIVSPSIVSCLASATDARRYVSDVTICRCSAFTLPPDSWNVAAK